MKKFTKVMCLIVALAMMVCCFAACSGTENAGNDEPKNEGGKELLIGATGPLTGDASSYGISVNNGALLAVKEINAAGGLNGITLKFDMKDDKATSEDASTGYDALMDAGMKISLGSVTSGSCEAFATKSVSDNLFFMTPSASAANVIADRSNAFRVCFGDPDQGTLAAKELTENFKNIGCIYDTSDTYSTGIFDAFKAEMDKLGTAFKIEKFDKENNKDFSTQAESLKDCDVIFLPIYYTEAGLIAKACVAKNSKALIFGCDGLDGIADQIEGVDVQVKYITPFDINSKQEVASKFVENYKAEYNIDPDQFAADGYDAIYAVFNAMKAAGIDDASISVSDLCNKVVTAITDPSFKYAGVTGEMTWDASGACNKVPVIVELG